MAHTAMKGNNVLMAKVVAMIMSESMAKPVADAATACAIEGRRSRERAILCLMGYLHRWCIGAKEFLQHIIRDRPQASGQRNVANLQRSRIGLTLEFGFASVAQ